MGPRARKDFVAHLGYSSATWTMQPSRNLVKKASCEICVKIHKQVREKQYKPRVFNGKSMPSAGKSPPFKKNSSCCARNNPSDQGNQSSHVATAAHHELSSVKPTKVKAGRYQQ